MCILQDRVKGWLVSAVELDGLSTKLLRQPETRAKERIIAIQYNNISTVAYHEQELMPQEVKTSLMDYLVIDKLLLKLLQTYRATPCRCNSYRVGLSTSTNHPRYQFSNVQFMNTYDNKLIILK